MFDPQDHARVFAAAPGVDFAQALINGLNTRLKNADPTDWARVEIYVNTRRMARHLIGLFGQGPAGLLPKIKLITDLAQDPILTQLPPVVPALKRRLEITRLVRQLLSQVEGLAPASAVYELSASLGALMEEMQGEGVPPSVIKDLDVSDQSGHWDRALQFIQIAQGYFDGSEAPTSESRQRAAVLALCENWKNNPPKHPILVAGSTGSRGTTLNLMQGVAQLPEGALILPGFDFAAPAHVWAHLTDSDIGEDHPQYRFAKIFKSLEMSPKQVARWDEGAPENTARNALVSLALRPAPATDHWLSEGPDLENLDQAISGITWLEAPEPRREAMTIALRLRQAVEDGETAAVITPDRNLTRRISTALSRWGITPDDSAGVPLIQSAPGRFLLHVFDLATDQITAETLLILLKHPLTHTGGDRQDHLRRTRDLELYLRKSGPAFLDSDTILTWAKKDDRRLPWAQWLIGVAFQNWPANARPLGVWLTQLLNMAQEISAGPSGGEGELWKQTAGRETWDLVQSLGEHGDAAGDVDKTEFSSILRGSLNTGEVRDFENAHPNVLIWGALEARVQSADLVILAGLNEGSWPEAPTPDPWLNRSLRKAAGLLLPDRNIGLAAHDFQQAIGGNQVWITRSLRSDDAETVPSRWLNRLENLLQGSDAGRDTSYLQNLKSKGETWLRLVDAVEAPQTTNPETRPSPAPPIEVRPDRLSVTEIKTLVRDPYAIYAKHVLGLRRLNPLVQTADAPLRGTVIHEIMAEFSRLGPIADAADGIARMRNISARMLDDLVPWPAARRSWQARIDRFADWFVAGELMRQSNRQSVAVEILGEVQIPNLGFTLRGTADRIDISNEGTAWIYDYKTGNPPTALAQKYFDKQLLLEVEMLRQGAFAGLGRPHVVGAEYLGLGAKPSSVQAPLDEADVWAEFIALIASYQDATKGYAARRAMHTADAFSDFDHLSRFGEWGTDQPAKKVDVT